MIVAWDVAYRKAYNSTVMRTMTKKITRVFGWMAMITLLVPASVFSQTTYNVTTDSKVWVDGTSSRSEWTVDGTSVTGHVKMADDASLEEVVMSVASKLKAPRGPIMQRLMDQALKIKQFSEVNYEMTSASAAEVDGLADNMMAFNTTGNLTLVGITQEIEMLVQGEKMDDGQIKFTGNHTINLADYKIKPPSAMFGNLTTGKEVVVNFELHVAQE